MEISRYQEVLGTFDRMLAHAIQVGNLLAKLNSDDEKSIYVNAIFTKLVCHALTLRKISPTLGQEVAGELWDISSACAIARALIETYEAFAYISASKTQPGETEFRVILWELHDLQRRIKMLNQIGSSNPEINSMETKVTSLQSRVINHQMFLKCSKNTQTKIKNGEAPPYHLSQFELNSMCGINHEYHNTATMALSQYVHTLPMAIHQLMSFRAGDLESLHMCSMPIQYSMAFLAKAVAEVTEQLPVKVNNPPEETTRDLEFWLEIAQNGINHI